MKRLVVVLIMVCGILAAKAQELNVTVQVSAQQIANVENTVFKDMQRAIFEFMNNRKWTNDNFETQERIEVNILINLTEAVSADDFKGTFQVTAKRPVFNSNYSSTIFKHVDRDFRIRYSPSIPMDFSVNSHLNNLTAILGFYAYYILGVDYDTFSLNGGSEHYQKALSIVNNAQSAQESGWKSFEDNDRNRYWLVNNILDPQFKPLRECYYKYHRLGFDRLEEKVEVGRAQVTSSLELIRKLHQRKPNSANVQLFFVAKVDEIINLYSQASDAEKNRLYQLLNQVDPGNSNKYQVLRKK